MVERKTRQTKTGNTSSIVNGALYFEDVKQCDVNSDAFVEMLEEKELKAIRVVSLDYTYLTVEWVDRDTSVKSHVDMEFTIRKEIRSGKAYWYAYRKVSGKLHKRFLGASERITLLTLKEMAKKLPTGRTAS